MHSVRRQARRRPRDSQERPNRVLILALLAVAAALAAADISAGALWELSGERYAHEVFDDAF
jgi:hypothetical protein